MGLGIACDCDALSDLLGELSEVREFFELSAGQARIASQDPLPPPPKLGVVPSAEAAAEDLEFCRDLTHRVFGVRELDEMIAEPPDGLVAGPVLRRRRGSWTLRTCLEDLRVRFHGATRAESIERPLDCRQTFAPPSACHSSMKMRRHIAQQK